MTKNLKFDIRLYRNILAKRIFVSMKMAVDQMDNDLFILYSFSSTYSKKASPDSLEINYLSS